MNDKEIELKAVRSLGFEPDDLPNYKEFMTYEDVAKVKGYIEGYKEALKLK